MPANLEKPFDPSCCDGGQTSGHESAMPCGCDKGAKWVCERHKLEQLLEEKLNELRKSAGEASGGSGQ